MPHFFAVLVGDEEVVDLSVAVVDGVRRIAVVADFQFQQQAAMTFLQGQFFRKLLQLQSGIGVADGLGTGAGGREGDADTRTKACTGHGGSGDEEGA